MNTAAVDRRFVDTVIADALLSSPSVSPTQYEAESLAATEIRPSATRLATVRAMGFTMAPAFFSTDLDRTSTFWGALGFTEVTRHQDYMVLEHPMGIVVHFGLAPELVPSENMTNAYLRFTTANEAVALYEAWVDRVSEDGFIHAPGTTLYGMIEWGMTDPDSNALRVGGPAEPH